MAGAYGNVVAVIGRIILGVIIVVRKLIRRICLKLLEDVHLAAFGPTYELIVDTQHPPRRPQAGTDRLLDRGFKIAILGLCADHARCSRVDAARRVDAADESCGNVEGRAVGGAGVGDDADVREAGRVALQLVVSPSALAGAGVILPKRRVDAGTNSFVRVRCPVVQGVHGRAELVVPNNRIARGWAGMRRSSRRHK